MLRRFFMVRAFPGANTYKAERYAAYRLSRAQPTITITWITKRFIKLKDRIGRIYCSLGVSSILFTGVSNKMISPKMDWWQTKMNNHMSITAAPAECFPAVV